MVSAFFKDVSPAPQRSPLFPVGQASSSRRDALAAPPRDDASPCRTEADATLTAQAQPTRPLSDFWELLKRDRKLADLSYGRKPIAGLRDQSRSGGEMSLVCKLRWYGFDFGQVDVIMRKARIGKWAQASLRYQQMTFDTL